MHRGPFIRSAGVTRSCSIEDVRATAGATVAPEALPVATAAVAEVGEQICGGSSGFGHLREGLHPALHAHTHGDRGQLSGDERLHLVADEGVHEDHHRVGHVLGLHGSDGGVVDAATDVLEEGQLQFGQLELGGVHEAETEAVLNVSATSQLTARVAVRSKTCTRLG